MIANRVAGVAFRNRVLAYLQGAGLPARNPLDKRLSELVGTPSAYTDVEGLGQWVIDVRTSASGDISTALNESRDAAKLAGSDWYVSLIGRRGYPVEDTYAVLPLSLMTRIFAGRLPDSSAFLSVNDEQLGH
jgi:hypothetical protein